MNNLNNSKNNLNVSIKSIKSYGSKKMNSINNMSPNKFELNNKKEDYYERNFSSVDFWSEFYRFNKYDTYDWYFPFDKVNLKCFNISKIDKKSEILVLGVGTSNLINNFFENEFTQIIFIDFVQELIDHLSEKYLNHEKISGWNWDCKF